MTATHALSPAMRSALSAAAASGPEGRIDAAKATIAALEERGLAFTSAESTYLTREGWRAGARLTDHGHPQPGAVVVYDGSLPDEAGNLFVVYAETIRGFVLRDPAYPLVGVLRRVRRASFHLTGTTQPLAEIYDCVRSDDRYADHEAFEGDRKCRRCGADAPIRRTITEEARR